MTYDGGDSIGDLRRYDLESLEDLTQIVLESAPISGLTFVKVETSTIVQASSGVATPEESPGEIIIEPTGLYEMQDALIGLHSQNAHIAYLWLSDRTGVNFYMGASFQPARGLSETDMAELSYDIQKSILQNIHPGIDIQKIVSSEDLIAKIEPFSAYVGGATYYVSETATEEELEHQSSAIKRITDGLIGLESGMLVLAVPAPLKRQEQDKPGSDQAQPLATSLDRAIGLGDCVPDAAKARQTVPRNSQRIWLAGLYYFAPKADVFVRLQSLLKTAYTAGASSNERLKTYVIKGMKEHLLQFGMINNRSSGSTEEVSPYKFLMALSSHELSTFVQFPKKRIATEKRFAGQETSAKALTISCSCGVQHQFI